MSTSSPDEILPTTEARAKLSQIAADFDHDRVNAEPVAFGSHRRPQGVIIPWELWLQIIPAIEDRLDAAKARHRLDTAEDERVSFDDMTTALGRDPSHFR